MTSQAVDVVFVADLDLIRYDNEIVKDEKGTKETGRWMVEGYAATSDIDSEGDRIDDAALQSAALDLQKYSTLLFNHNNDRPVGAIELAKFTPNGLFVRAEISKSEPDIWVKIQDKTLNKFSVRGRILEVDREFSKERARWIRVIKKLTLFEASIVSVPANPEAKALRWYISKALGSMTSEAVVGGKPMAETKQQEVPAPVPAPKTEAAAPEVAKSTAQVTSSPVVQKTDVTAPAETKTAQPETTAKPVEKPVEKAEPKPAEVVDLTMAEKSVAAVKEVIGLLEKLSANASAEQKQMIAEAKKVLEQLASGKYPYPYPKPSAYPYPEPQKAEAQKLLNKRLAAFVELDIQEAQLLLASAEQMEKDPARKHLLAGTSLMLRPREEEAKKAVENPNDPIKALVEAVEKMTSRLVEIEKRLTEVEKAKCSTPLTAEEERKKKEEAKKDQPVVAAEATKQASATEPVVDPTTELRKMMETLEARIKKVEKTECVAQSIPGQDVEKSKTPSNDWIGIFSPALAQAMGRSRS